MPNGQALAGKVSQWSGEIVARGMDPANWGMAKSFTMKAEADGIDTTDEQAMQRHVAEYNLRMVHDRAEPNLSEDDPPENELPIPISDVPTKIGRNASCPCGSGMKYKKCCGKTQNDAIDE